MNIATTILDGLMLWGIVGALVAALFLSIGIDQIDEDARGAYWFRPLLVPGILLLWPLVLWRWWVIESGRDRWQKRHAPPRRAHAPAWLLLAVLIPLILAAALLLRQPWPAHIAPQQLSPAADGKS